jgi:NADPH2 dehydrogenase
MFSANEGCLSQFQIDHYMHYAYSNLGAIILESTAISAKGRITKNDLCLYNNKHVNSLKKFIQEFRKRKSKTKIGIQLSHSGKKASLKVPENGSRPKEIFPIHLGGWKQISNFNEETLHKITKEFEKSIKLAQEIGFDFIELHMGHGYLFHHLITEKQDMIFIETFLRTIRKKVNKNIPLGVRISHGYSKNIEEDISINIELSKVINANSYSYITISNGGIKNNAEKYLLKEITQINQKITIPLILVGEINSLKTILKYQKNNINLFAIGRSLLRNPYFIYELESQLKLKYSGPRQYSRAFN